MSLRDCLDVGFTEAQCKFLFRPKRRPTAPLTTESMDDFLQRPRAREFIQDLTEANKSEATEALAVDLGRLQCSPVGNGMIMCTM